jgi:hypothetical protein
MVASWTPCVASLTVSSSGHLVAATRRRRSTSAASGKREWNGRILPDRAVADSSRAELCRTLFFSLPTTRLASNNVFTLATQRIAHELLRPEVRNAPGCLNSGSTPRFLLVPGSTVEVAVVLSARLGLRVENKDSMGWWHTRRARQDIRRNPGEWSDGAFAFGKADVD